MNIVSDTAMNTRKSFYEGIEEQIKSLYLEGMCAEEIKETLSLSVSVRAIQRFISKLGITRTMSEQKRISIERGRHNYDYMRVKVQASTFRKALQTRERYAILLRDGFRCTICGLSAKEGIILQVDHIISPVEGGTNEPSNLRTTCHLCNYGKSKYEAFIKKHGNE